MLAFFFQASDRSPIAPGCNAACSSFISLNDDVPLVNGKNEIKPADVVLRNANLPKETSPVSNVANHFENVLPHHPRLQGTLSKILKELNEIASYEKDLRSETDQAIANIFVQEQEAEIQPRTSTSCDDDRFFSDLMDCAPKSYSIGTPSTDYNAVTEKSSLLAAVQTEPAANNHSCFSQDSPSTALQVRSMNVSSHSADLIAGRKSPDLFTKTNLFWKLQKYKSLEEKGAIFKDIMDTHSDMTAGQFVHKFLDQD